MKQVTKISSIFCVTPEEHLFLKALQQRVPSVRIGFWNHFLENVIVIKVLAALSVLR
jgi:hypothetical protein